MSFFKIAVWFLIRIFIFTFLISFSGGDILSLRYFRELHCPDSTTLSVDKLVVIGKLYGRSDEVGSRFWVMIRKDIFCNYSDWVSFRIGTYRYQYSVLCSNGCSFWFGIGFNSADSSFSENCNKWCLEFNPNKVFTEYLFLKVYTSLFQLSRNIEIKRFDLAVDYLVDRSCTSLVKDNRTYTEYSNSIDNRTQSLGHHNQHGHIKLYNKQLESKLPVPLTRLELTIDYKKRSFCEFQKIFPCVYVIENFQMRLDSVQLTDTDRFILLCCLEDTAKLRLLGRWKRQKIESLMTNYTRSLSVDEKFYNRIVRSISDFIDFEFLLNHFSRSDVRPRTELLSQFYNPDDFIDLSDASDAEIAELNNIFS